MSNSICITIVTIVGAFVLVGLVVLVVLDRISAFKADRDRAARDEKQRVLNQKVKHLKLSILDCESRGFINCEYAFDRFYIHYERLYNNGLHYSITESFWDSGIPREKYARLGTKLGTATNNDSADYQQMRRELLTIINNIYNETKN